MSHKSAAMSQCQKPTGWPGRFILWAMNLGHSKLTDWGLAHTSVEKHYIILDVGCGGGRTVSKLADAAAQGKVYGIDFSEESVAASKRTNASWIDMGRVEINHGSVSQLPYSNAMFDLVTAVDTHIWWPNLPGDMREIFRVLKPGGRLIVTAEVYKGATTRVSKLLAVGSAIRRRFERRSLGSEKYAGKTGMNLLSIDEHRELFTRTGYSDVKVIEESTKGWICAVGKKP